jgi:outer membrane protein assembly factor BamB
MMKRTLPVLIFAFAVSTATATDWPQWRGPDRTDVSKEKGLLKTWPEGGPKLLWTFRDAGMGYAGFAIVGDRLYSMGADDKAEYLFAIDLKTQKKLWSTELGKLYQEGHGDGPRGTPTVDGPFVYGIGSLGTLICVKADSGEKVWSKNFTTDFGGGQPHWAFTESPLVDGDKVVCTPGGRQGAVVALNKKTGEVVWQSKEFKDNAAYSSLVATELGGVRQYIQLTAESVVGIAAEDGKLLWRHARAGRTAVIPTPIVSDNLVYVSSGYRIGCNLVKVNVKDKEFKTEEVYANKNMVNHHGGVILVGEHLYGYCDDGKGWVCQNFKTGEVVWSENKKLGKGSLTCADGHLYCYSENGGNVVLAKATPEGWKEDGRFKIPEETKLRKPDGKIWTHPVVANGRLYLRDQDLIFCYDVKANGAE